MELERKCCEYNDTGGVNAVAIIGAGFAGLTLANYLELQQPEYPTKNSENPRWTYTLFESRPSGVSVVGTICLDSARHVLEELRLFEVACSERGGASIVFPKHNPQETSSTNARNDDDYKEVSRESFLDLLRKRAKIRWSSRVVDVIEESSKRGSLRDNQTPNYYIVTEVNGCKRTKHGPFNLVVVANGLSFRGEATKALRQKLKASSSIIRIGDSRYQYDRSWWEFDFLGFTRRKSGADVAIRDGLSVGRRLMKRDPIQKRQENQRFQQIIIMVLIPVILALRLYC